MEVKRTIKGISEYKTCFSILLLKGLFALFMCFCLAACSSSDSLLSDVSHSDCSEIPMYATRSSTSPVQSYLMITREGKDLHCAWHNYTVGCSYRDIIVDCQQEGNVIDIETETVMSKEEVALPCLCYVSLYFTIRDVEAEQFSFRIKKMERTYPLDFTGHSFCKIDLNTGETVYD